MKEKSYLEISTRMGTRFFSANEIQIYGEIFLDARLSVGHSLKCFKGWDTFTIILTLSQRYSLKICV